MGAIALEFSVRQTVGSARQHICVKFNGVVLIEKSCLFQM